MKQISFLLCYVQLFIRPTKFNSSLIVSIYIIDSHPWSLLSFNLSSHTRKTAKCSNNQVSGDLMVTSVKRLTFQEEDKKNAINEEQALDMSNSVIARLAIKKYPIQAQE